MIGKINSQNQIKLNQKLIKKMLGCYNLSAASFKEIKTGVENTSALIKTNKGKFVLRVYRRNNKTVGEILQELKFMSFLRSQGIPVPKALLNLKEKSISRVKINKRFWNYILMPFIEGKHLASDQYYLIPAAAKYQALMHRAAGKFKKANRSNDFKKRFNSFIVQNKNAEKFLKQKKGCLDIKKMIDQVTRDIKNNADEFDGLPSGLVHLDYDSDNILTKGGKVAAILDFDDLSFQPFIADLGNSLWWWLFTNKNKSLKLLYKRYLEGYQKYRRLSKKESKFLPLFTKMRNISVAIFDINNGGKKSQKEWKKILKFDKEIDGLNL